MSTREVEQRIRDGLEESESSEPGVVLVLSRDLAQLLVDEVGTSRLRTAERVAENWQRILTDRTRAARRDLAVAEHKLNRLRADYQHLEGWARGQSRRNAFAVQVTYYAQATTTPKPASRNGISRQRTGSSERRVRRPPTQERIVPIKILGHWEDARVHATGCDLFIVRSLWRSPR